MWRFLHSIPRALKNYHAPRASIGVYVDSDDKEQEATVNEETSSTNCVAKVPGQNTCGFNDDSSAGERNFLWRFAVPGNHIRTCHEQNGGGGTGEEEDSDWWNCCQKDIWAFLHGSSRMLGSTITFRSHNKKNEKDILYRVLYSICDIDGIALVKKKIKDDAPVEDAPVELSKREDQTLLAIKDAEGSAHDGVINQSKPESLDSALKAFKHMCSDYTAQNESLLAIVAADKGEMSEAVKHFHLSCSMGNKTACFNLGLCYETGSGVTKNLDKAKHYYELAAFKGHGEAMYNLGLLYLNGEGTKDGDGDTKKGIDLMEMAAKTGLAQAQTYMGIYYMEEKGNAKTAAAYFKAAAGQNDREAQYFLALCHEHGLGVEVNECSAAHLYSLGACAGHDGAIFNLARFVEKGLGGIPSDPTAAIELYTKAAKLGNEDAKIRLEELRTLKRKEEQSNNLDQVLTTQTPVSDRNKTISSSSSSPDLRETGRSLRYFFYQRMYRYLHNSVRSQSLFDPGGADQTNLPIVRFRIGGDREIEGEDVDDSKSPTECGEIDRHQSGSVKCNPVHKSNTTPDLSSMVLCNI